MTMTLEVFFPHDLRLALCRTGFTLLQGTWFYHIGFILYPPRGFARWNETDHKQMMTVTMMFTWNIAAIIVFQVRIAGGGWGAKEMEMDAF